MRTLFMVFAASGILAVLGCGADRVACPGDLQVELFPADTTIAVGQSFHARVGHIDDCSDHPTPIFVRDSTTWRSVDRAVVRVDSVSGSVTGLAVGDARVDQAQHAWVALLVHVR